MLRRDAGLGPRQHRGLLLMLSFLDRLPRFLFFTGKGGVGKTSLACASATRLADDGRRVLLVSTDPASNVAQVFGQTIGNRITRIDAVPRLDAIEIDPHQAADAYRERIIGPVRNLLPEAEIASITEQLSGSCTTEVASFNEFTDLLADDDRIQGYEHIVFDTAPTGHTIRLLQLPGEWTSFLDEGKGDASCLGPMAGLDKTRATYAAALARLSDPGQTRLVLVTRAQASTLAEAGRTSEELAKVGITEQHLLINALLTDPGEDDLASAVHHREQQALSELPASLGRLARTEISLRPSAVVGVQRLRELLAAEPELPVEQPLADPVDAEGLGDLVAQLAKQDHGLVMCMGKGGVGKSTVAAALALALAERGKTVHLSTTDPAAHLDEVLGGANDEHLSVSRIDPQAAIGAYREKVMRTKGARLDDAGRAQLAEDLMSPCTEEVAVFGEFSHLVSQARRQFVVVDTAPTGHTLLLMDATGSYHRDIVRGMGGGQSPVTPLMRLQDPVLTKVVIVTLPEATPVQEAADLQAELRRAQIEPWAWVINQSLTAARTSSPLLAARAAEEAGHLATVESLAQRVAVVPLLAEEPTGTVGLSSLIDTLEPA